MSSDLLNRLRQTGAALREAREKTTPEWNAIGDFCINSGITEMIAEFVGDDTTLDQDAANRDYAVLAHQADPGALLIEAVAEIERLTKALLLISIQSCDKTKQWESGVKFMQETANKALEGAK